MWVRRHRTIFVCVSEYKIQAAQDRLGEETYCTFYDAPGVQTASDPLAFSLHHCVAANYCKRNAFLLGRGGRKGVIQINQSFQCFIKLWGGCGWVVEFGWIDAANSGAVQMCFYLTCLCVGLFFFFLHFSCLLKFSSSHFPFPNLSAAVNMMLL